MATTGKVVVVVTPQIGTHEESGYTVARFSELSLWAHGEDQATALESLKAHFRTFIEVLRETGELEERLTRAGVEWCPVAQAEQQGIEYEDLGCPADNRSDSLGAREPRAAILAVAWDYRLAQAA